ncbi:hypothetical protein CcCBS67573_g08001 [Chytriomyces confervae]|uniref:Poly(A) RNA polymerase mitochondrial-like central palm domain-containing protein n=1 Tax=Chytriomyces confervae TaxID=246404 RepID=A0A507ENN5_9FUNG|nr:hypothetical protein CcCBS67573_g08001 [Chytriomyces confervae]
MSASHAAPPRFQQTLSSNEDVVRSLLTHVAFAHAVIAGHGIESEGDGFVRVDLGETVSLTRQLLENALSNPSTTNSNPSNTSTSNSSEDTSNMNKTLAIASSCSAFSICANTPKFSARAKELLRLSLTPALTNLLRSASCCYELRFKGRTKEEGAAWNGTKIIVHAPMSDPLFAHVQTVLFGSNGEIQKDVDNRDIHQEDVEKEAEDTSNPDQQQEQPSLFRQKSLSQLECKTRVINIAISLMVSSHSITSTASTPKTISIATLARRVRRLYYEQYILTEAAPAPYYNLGTSPTDPEYDLHEEGVSAEDLELERVQSAVMRRKWPFLWTDWNFVRGATSKAIFRRNLFDQWIPLVVDIGMGIAQKEESSHSEKSVLTVDVVEDNGAREYPWVVIMTLASEIMPAEETDRVFEKLNSLLERIAGFMTVRDIPARAAVLELPETSGDALADAQIVARTVILPYLKTLNPSLLLIECKERLEDAKVGPRREIRSLLATLKDATTKRRTAFRNTVMNMKVQFDARDDDENEHEGKLEGENASQKSTTKSLIDQVLFDGFVDPVKSLLEKIRPPTGVQLHRHQFLSNLQSIITNAFGPGYTAHLFGSSFTTLANPTSDADVTILLDDPAVHPSTHPISNMYLLAAILRHHGMQNVFPVATAKVPIVKFYDPVCKLNADVNVGNALGIQNSRMIIEYMKVDPRVRDLILLVKHWAGKRDLNNSAEGGTFSSYALTLMLLSYLQIAKVVPSLQALYPSNESRQYIIARVNTPMLKSTRSKQDAKATAARVFAEYKDRLRQTSNTQKKQEPELPNLESLNLVDNNAATEESIKSFLVHQIPASLDAGMVFWDVSFVPANHAAVAPFIRAPFADERSHLQSLVHVLHGFFEHYGHVHRFHSSQIISVRKGGVIGRRETHVGLNVRKPGSEKAGELTVVVEDPFQLDRNTAGMVKQVIPVINEFRRAAAVLSRMVMEESVDYTALLDELMQSYRASAAEKSG